MLTEEPNKEELWKKPNVNTGSWPIKETSSKPASVKGLIEKIQSRPLGFFSHSS